MKREAKAGATRPGQAGACQTRCKPDLFLVPLSSQLANTDFPLQQWHEAGLNLPCGVKAQTVTVEDAPVIKIAGQFRDADHRPRNQRLRTWLER